MNLLCGIDHRSGEKECFRCAKPLPPLTLADKFIIGLITGVVILAVGLFVYFIAWPKLASSLKTENVRVISIAYDEEGELMREVVHEDQYHEWVYDSTNDGPFVSVPRKNMVVGLTCTQQKKSLRSCWLK